jgi:aminoglycoside/choline kinase family phosphotransferase
LLKKSIKMQQELRRLTQQLISAQEDERLKISRELHDVIAQTLTGINIRLATLKQQASLKGKDFNTQIDSTQREMLDKTFQTIVQRNLAAPSVYVHRDFMPRNLMMPHDPNEQRLGVLDFQDAVYGPITYDIASLMRDAFLTWEEDVVLDVTVRYWERARKLALMDFEDWHNDFGAFYRAVEWMGLQRHLKVAGIFARLTLRDGKPKYLADAPRFINYIRSTASRYSELTPLLRLIDKIEGTEPAISLAFPRLNGRS